MSVQLDAPVAIQEFAHADELAVEYVLHPNTTSVRVLVEGDDGRVHVGFTLYDEGDDLPALGHVLQLAAGVLSEPIPFPGTARALQTFGSSLGKKSRAEGRRLLVALNTGPGTVRIVSDRGA